MLMHLRMNRWLFWFFLGIYRKTLVAPRALLLLEWSKSFQHLDIDGLVDMSVLIRFTCDDTFFEFRGLPACIWVLRCSNSVTNLVSVSSHILFSTRPCWRIVALFGT